MRLRFFLTRLTGSGPCTIFLNVRPEQGTPYVLLSWRDTERRNAHVMSACLGSIEKERLGTDPPTWEIMFALFPENRKALEEYSIEVARRALAGPAGSYHYGSTEG